MWIFSLKKSTYNACAKPWAKMLSIFYILLNLTTSLWCNYCYYHWHTRNHKWSKGKWPSQEQIANRQQKKEEPGIWLCGPLPELLGCTILHPMQVSRSYQIDFGFLVAKSFMSLGDLQCPNMLHGLWKREDVVWLNVWVGYQVYMTLRGLPCL